MQIRTVIAASFVFMAAVSGAEDLNIAASAEDTKPVKVGEQAPGFTVQRVDGTPFHFDPSSLQRPAMLITFRGGWCPFCNMHLQELRHVVPELKQSGYDVLFLSADRPEILYSSLKDENQELDYTILSDAQMQASSRLGIAFKVPDAYIERLKQNNLDLEKAAGNTLHALPVPAVFIIDTAGVIRFAHVNPDYRVRLSADAVRTAAIALLQPL